MQAGPELSRGLGRRYAAPFMSIGLVPKRKHQSNYHQPKEREVDETAWWMTRPGDGQNEEDQSPAQMFHQEQ